MDENLAQRVCAELAGIPGLTAKRMFGGIGYMIHGNMDCGVLKESLIVRVGLGRHGEALARPDTRVFDITGKPMVGWVMVAAPGFESDADLQQWVRWGVEYALSLPPK